MTTSLPRIMGALVLSAISISSCRCIDHPLYNWKTNRYDGWYLGGGNSQTRPWPGGHMELDPRAGALDLVLADPEEPGDGPLLQIVGDEEVLAELSADLVVMEDGEATVLARLERGSEGCLEVALDRDLEDGEAWIVFYDATGTEFTLDIRSTGDR